MKFKVKPKPKDRESKISKVFALFPIECVDGNYHWLEYILAEKVYDIYSCEWKSINYFPIDTKFLERKCPECGSTSDFDIFDRGVDYYCSCGTSFKRFVYDTN